MKLLKFWFFAPKYSDFLNISISSFSKYELSNFHAKTKSICATSWKLNFHAQILVILGIRMLQPLLMTSRISKWLWSTTTIAFMFGMSVISKKSANLIPSSFIPLVFGAWRLTRFWATDKNPFCPRVHLWPAVLTTPFVFGIWVRIWPIIRFINGIFTVMICSRPCISIQIWIISKKTIRPM